MQSSAVLILFLILLGLLCIVLPVLMGIYVFRDATARGMSALLWVLIALLAPGFIGLIIYLIVRVEHPNLRCASCHQPIRASYAVCPHCGVDIKPRCERCGTLLNAAWTHCPTCGAELSADRMTAVPEKKKDRSLGLLLALIIGIPLLIFVALITSFFLLRSTQALDSYLYSATAEVTRAQVNTYPEFEQWIAACQISDTPRMLRMTDTRDGKPLTRVLFYASTRYTVDHVDYATHSFRKPSLRITCSPTGGGTPLEPDDPVTVQVYEIYGADVENLRVVGADDSALQFDQNELPAGASVPPALSTRGEKDLYVSVEVSPAVNTVYGVDCAVYANGECLSSEGSARADETPMTGDETSFDLSPYLNKADEIKITLYDADQHPIVTHAADIGADGIYRFLADYDANGTLTLHEVK